MRRQLTSRLWPVLVFLTKGRNCGNLLSTSARHGRPTDLKGSQGFVNRLYQVETSTSEEECGASVDVLPLLSMRQIPLPYSR